METTIIEKLISKGLSTKALINNLIAECRVCGFSASICKVIDHFDLLYPLRFVGEDRSCLVQFILSKTNFYLIINPKQIPSENKSDHLFKTGCYCLETSSVQEFLENRRIEQAILDEIKVGNLITLKTGKISDRCAIKCKLCDFTDNIFNIVYHCVKNHRADSILHNDFGKLKPKYKGEDTEFLESVQYIKYTIFSSLPEKIHVNFKCYICDKTLYQRSDLNRHLKTVHAKIKDHACLKCGKKFTQKSDVKRHHKTVHLKIKEFECIYCKKFFGQLASLKKHLYIHK